MRMMLICWGEDYLLWRKSFNLK